jgi:hypothetical protein
MQSITDLANYALAQIGEGFRITDFDDDQSAEGQACRDTYQGLLEEKLRERRWNRFVMKAPLALVATNPNPVWGFSYRYPSNCLDFHRILNGDRSGLDVHWVVFELSSDSQGLLIFTDWGFTSTVPGVPPGTVYGEWTVQNPPLNLWASDFKTAFAFEWASIMAPFILKNSSPSTVARLKMEAARKWIRAKSTDYREQILDKRPVSRIQRARGSGRRFTGRYTDEPAQ